MSGYRRMLHGRSAVPRVEGGAPELEYRLSIRIGGMLTVAIGVVTALTTLLDGGHDVRDAATRRPTAD